MALKKRDVCQRNLELATKVVSQATEAEEQASQAIQQLRASIAEPEPAPQQMMIPPEVLQNLYAMAGLPASQLHTVGTMLRPKSLHPSRRHQPLNLFRALLHTR